MSTEKNNRDLSETEALQRTAEVDSLRAKVEHLESVAAETEEASGIRRRSVVATAWVAPLFMSVGVPQQVFAQTSPIPEENPGPEPT